VSYAFTEVRLGLAPAVISLTTLPRLTERAASETFLGGHTFDAVEARRIGLVTRTVPDSELDAAVEGDGGDGHVAVAWADVEVHQLCGVGHAPILSQSPSRLLRPGRVMANDMPQRACIRLM
jgi:hypothetical protein